MHANGRQRRPSPDLIRQAARRPHSDQKSLWNRHRRVTLKGRNGHVKMGQPVRTPGSSRLFIRSLEPTLLHASLERILTSSYLHRNRVSGPGSRNCTKRYDHGLQAGAKNLGLISRGCAHLGCVHLGCAHLGEHMCVLWLCASLDSGASWVGLAVRRAACRKPCYFRVCVSTA